MRLRVLSAIAVGLASQLALAQELREATFDRWADYIRPDEQESCFLDIQWRDGLATGVEESFEHRKPILLWAMNGHPLGCT